MSGQSVIFGYPLSAYQVIPAVAQVGADKWWYRSKRRRVASDVVGIDAFVGRAVRDMQMTVLIADDNPEMLKALASFLSTSFAVVGQARNGAAALSGIEELHPDLAVLDVSMPLMNGFEVARRLQQAESPTRVVFCTLLRDAEFIEEARRCGHGYVLKSRLHCDLRAALDAARKGKFFASPT